MRKYIYSIIALLMVTLCSAQLYVSQAEYFWDTDPGTGNGTPVLATDGNLNSAFEYLTKTGIATPGNGLHKLCLRVKDNTGVWGPVFTNIINVQQNNTSTIMAVSQAEYFWDTDPGTGNGTQVLATDGNFDSTYEQLTKTGINLPSAGLHVFNIRVKDNSGVWGPVFKNVINIQSATVSGCWKMISAGNTHSMGIKTDGTLWGWGENSLGQLGDGTSISRNVPVQIGTANNWQKIFAGQQYSVGIKTDGTLWAWGYNNIGQLGDGTFVNRIVPVQIGNSTDWINVSVGNGSNLAIKSNGTLWGWGNNFRGQLGDGTNFDKNVPTQIGTATNWKTVDIGEGFSLAIKNNGTLWTWGYNDYGQLGDGTTSNRLLPGQIGTDVDWADVAAGYSHSVARKANGILYTWGNNSSGQLGDGTNINRYTPIAVYDGIQSIDAGWYNTIGVNTYGNMFSCGHNLFGQLGDGTNNNRNWISVGNATNHKLISAGAFHTLSLDTNHNLKSCGINEQGRLGDGTLINKNTLTAIACPVSNLAVDEIIPTVENLKVFPNPVNDILNISSDQKIISITVFNASGQLIITKVINDKKTAIHVSGLLSGVYTVKIDFGDKNVKTVKVIKR